ncbi:YheU family protein [Desulfobacterales bacterium HSG16]|nr:YheU family protein [Desulfobacterales bacterium HSG16]
MEIPYNSFKPEILRAVIEEIITREGTDYGEQTLSLEKKIDQAMSRLKTGRALITYDEKTQTCNLKLKQ